MAEVGLHQLEEEVEAARAKLVGDLAALRSKSVLAEFTDNLKSEAAEAKDVLLESAKAKAQSVGSGILDDLKAKAAENPTAVLAIGAGLAWRFLRDPPIATALVGVGLLSLLRTDTGDEYEQEADHFARAKQRLREQAGYAGRRVGEQVYDAGQRFEEQASQAARRFGEQVSRTGERLGTELSRKRQRVEEQTSSVVRILEDHVVDAGARLGGQVSKLTETVKDLAEDAEATVREKTAGLRAGRKIEDRSGDLISTPEFPDDEEEREGAEDRLAKLPAAMTAAFRRSDTRDKLLIGFAGLAIAAAAGLSRWR